MYKKALRHIQNIIFNNIPLFWDGYLLKLSCSFKMVSQAHTKEYTVYVDRYFDDRVRRHGETMLEAIGTQRLDLVACAFQKKQRKFAKKPELGLNRVSYGQRTGIRLGAPCRYSA